MRWIIPVFMVVSLCSFPALCQAEKRFHQPQITATEWRQYFEEIKNTPGAVIQTGQEQTLITINTNERHEAYFFTTLTHPAHPAVVRVIVFVDETKSTRSQVFGNYAGSKEEFDPWFKSLLAKVVRTGR